VTTVIAFDVNETLLDLRAEDPAFEELLGSAALRLLAERAGKQIVGSDAR
jgi:hypothetical protein